MSLLTSGPASACYGGYVKTCKINQSINQSIIIFSVAQIVNYY